MFAHDGRLHDPLRIDHTTEATAPRGVDQRGGGRPAIESGVIAVGQFAVIGDDDADRRIELAETAQHPILPPLLVVARDAHRFEQLDRAADLPFAVDALEGMAAAEFAAIGHSRQNILRVSLADPVERLAGDDMEMPRLGVHRAGRTHSEREDFLDQFARNRLVQIAADAAPSEDDLVIIHAG